MKDLNRTEKKQAYKKIVEELKSKPFFMIICSNGKMVNTIINGNNEGNKELIDAFCSSILHNSRSREIVKESLRLMENDLMKGKVVSGE